MWRRLRQLSVLGGCMLLVGCGTQPVNSGNAGTYTVKAGDTLYSIATRNGVDLQSLARLNNIDKNFRIYPGQVLRLSKNAAVPASRTSQAATSPVTRAPVLPPNNIKWSWPASSNSFAATTRPNGGVGLVINGRALQDIRAAASGRVVYTGSGLLGYGQLIIIKHDEAFLSAYGHNEVVLVREGEQVSAGQKIATMGNGPTGAAMLYFEIRVNGQPVDPLALLQEQK